jgi:hypothetical protein
MAQAAAVIDLDEFRRRREDGRQEKRPPTAMCSPRHQFVLPVWVMWVPVWPVVA